MRFVILAALVLLVPAFASAQSIEVFGVTGGTQVWDDEGNIGFGVPLGAGIGFKSPNGWGIEGLFDTQKAERNFSSGVRFDSTIIGARARVLKYFGNSGVQPYAGGGLGFTQIESTRAEPPGFGGVFSSTSKAATISGFGGVRIPAGNRLFVRPEFEIARSGEHLRMGGNVAIGVAW
jgi:hypothetical protein